MSTLSNPKVSVVMPTYNRAELLPKTIASILSQDFGDFELIIVDDGSQDSTQKILEQIERSDARVHYIQVPENHGNAYARNVGMRQAGGAYIAMADSDDLWLPGKLKLQIEILEKHPEVDILFGNYWNIDYVRGTEADGFVETRIGSRHLRARSIAEKVWLIDGGFEEGILAMDFIATPTLVLKADILRSVGNFNENLRSAVDFEFYFRAALLGAKYAYSEQTLIKRYRYQSSVTAQTINANRQMLRALSICRRTCQNVQRFELLKNIRDAELRTWQRLIRQYSVDGRRFLAWQAYLESVKCGFSLRALFLLIGALAGPQAMLTALKIKRALRIG